MMAGTSREDDSNAEVLHELQCLSQSLHQSDQSCFTTSLVLPRSSMVIPAAADGDGPRLTSENARSDRNSRSSRRMSISFRWFRPKPKLQMDGDDNSVGFHRNAPSKTQQHKLEREPEKKKGIWNWKPIRALAHMTMHHLACLFSVDVIEILNLPASMNGLRLAVAIRKKETKDGALQTMPSRVLDGSADFEETLFIRCHLHCTGGAGTGKPLKFEPRPFLISAVAIDVPELNFGKITIDLSLLVKESIENNLEGERIREWNISYQLFGKAKEAVLVLKLAFQNMDDGGLGIYTQTEETRLKQSKRPAFSISRKQSESSFRLASSRVSRSEMKGTKEITLDGLGQNSSSVSSIRNPNPKLEEEDLELPDFEVIEKGVEFEEEKDRKEETVSDISTEISSVSDEFVKEGVHDHAHRRIKELELIAREIKALELMMIEDIVEVVQTDEEKKYKLEVEEEMVTREFLNTLDFKDNNGSYYDLVENASPSKVQAKIYETDSEKGVFLSDLGKSLGCVVQTKDGGFLVSLNPFNTQVARKETPKLAMQISRVFVLKDHKGASGFEYIQRMAALGLEEMESRMLSLVAMDDLLGKTAEQIAFEGIASAIISGRSNELASSSAARTIATVKKMAAAMSEGRKERNLTGIWNMSEEPVTIDEILKLSLQTMEAMAVDALKIQAEMSEEGNAFDVFLLKENNFSFPLDSAVPLEDWMKTCKDSETTILVVIQLRDPLRSYEAVGAPMMAVLQARLINSDDQNEESRFKLTSLHVGGFKSGQGRKMDAWNGEKQRLTAKQWLVKYGMGKGGKRIKQLQEKDAHDLLWSISSRVVADIWLKPTQNPILKISSKNSNR